MQDWREKYLIAEPPKEDWRDKYLAEESPRDLRSITGSYGEPVKFEIGHPDHSAPYSSPEDIREEKFLGALDRFTPEIRERAIAAQQQPLPYEGALGAGDRYTTDFLRGFGPATIGLVAKAGELAQIDDLTGTDLSPASDLSYLDTLSQLNPSRSFGESLGRGAAYASGFGASIAASPATPVANLGANVAGRAATGLGASGLPLGAARLSGALTGFTAPEAALDAASGRMTTGEAAMQSLGAGPRFMAEIPQMVGDTVAHASQGEMLEAAESGAPLALMALAHRKKGGDPSEVKSKGQELPTEAKEVQGQEVTSLPSPPKSPESSAATGAPGTPLRSSPILRWPGMSGYGESIINRVERQSPEGMKVGQEARESVKIASRVTARSDATIRNEIEPLMRTSAPQAITSKIPGTKAAARAKEIRALETPEQYDQYGLGESNTYAMLEGRAQPRNQLEQQYFKSARKVLDEQFRIGKRFGIETVGAKPQQPGLMGNPPQRAPRMMTPEFFAVVRNGGPQYQQMVQGITEHPMNKAAGITPQFVGDTLREMTSAKAERSIPMEIARQIPWMPSHMKFEGKTTELMVSQPLDYIRTATRHVGNRIGFIAKFGQKTKGQAVGAEGETVDILRKELQGKVREEDLDAMFHVLNDRPLRKFDLTLSPVYHGDHPGAGAIDFVKQAAYGFDRIAKGAMLSLSPVVNIPEQGGTTLPFFSPVDIGNGVRNVMPDRYATTSQRMLQNGVITRNAVDFRTRPGRRIADTGRLVSEVLMLPTRFTNEAQETSTGAVAEAFAERLKTGQGTSMDRSRLNVLQFTPEQISKIVDGTAHPSEYVEVARRANTMVSGTTAARAERGRMENNPLATKVFSFQSYAQTQIRLADRILGNIVEAKKSGDAEAYRNAWMLAGKFFAGKTASGHASRLLMGAVAGYEWQKRDESWYEQIARDMAQAFGGMPVALAQGLMTSDENTMNVAQRLSPSVNAITSLSDSIRGTGDARGKDIGERVIDYLKRFTTATRAQRGFLVAMGLEDPKMNSAIAAYGRWQRKIEGKKEAKLEDEGKEVREHLYEAARLVRNGRTDEAGKEMQAAADLLKIQNDTPMREVRNRLGKLKKLARWDPKQLASLKKEIGEDYYKTLETHDKLLDNFAWESPSAGEFFQAKRDLSRQSNELEKQGQKPPREDIKQSKRYDRVDDAIRRLMQAKDRTQDPRRKEALQRKIDQLLERYSKKKE